MAPTPVPGLRRRIPAPRRLLVFEPEVVVRGGETDLPTGLTSSQLTDEELDSLLRQQGVFHRSQLAVVGLEPTGQRSARRRVA